MQVSVSINPRHYSTSLGQAIDLISLVSQLIKPGGTLLLTIKLVKKIRTKELKDLGGKIMEYFHSKCPHFHNAKIVWLLSNKFERVLVATKNIIPNS
jgi:hypothetical protein